MVKVDVKGCCGFVDGAKYDAYVGKALDAFDVLVAGNGAGNDFLGWKHLPSETPESLIADCEAIRDDWKAKGVDLVIAIGIGGSYLGAKCAIEALSHNFAKQLAKKDAAEVVFAGNNLSEEYLAELMDLAAERNVACIVISKSGTTTEPAVAFRIVKQYLEDTYGKKEAAERIVKATRPSSSRTTWAAASPSSPPWASCPSWWPDSTCAPSSPAPSRPRRPSP